MLAIGDILRKNGNFDQAEVTYIEIVAKIQKLVPSNSTLCILAAAYRGLGLIYKKRADYDNALKWHTQAVVTLTKMLQNNNSNGGDNNSGYHMELGNCLLDLGDIYRKREQHGEALATYTQSLNHLVATTGSKSIGVAEVYYSQSLSYLALRKDREAFETIEKARLILTDTYKNGHYKLGMVKTVLAKISSLRQDYESANRLFEDAIIELTKELGADHLEVADTWVDLADCILKQMSENRSYKPHLGQAVQQLTTARDIYAKQFGVYHTKVSQCESRLYILQHGDDL
jgi:tetratricopeptide (TPR) repeat protein